MYTLIILAVLCLIEFVIIWLKWSDFQDWKEMGTMVVETVSSGNGRVSQSVNKVVVPAKKGMGLVFAFFGRFKGLLIIPIVLLFIINVVMSIILGAFISLIVSFL